MLLSKDYHKSTPGVYQILVCFQYVLDKLIQKEMDKDGAIETKIQAEFYSKYSDDKLKSSESLIKVSPKSWYRLPEDIAESEYRYKVDLFKSKNVSDLAKVFIVCYNFTKTLTHSSVEEYSKIITSKISTGMSSDYKKLNSLELVSSVMSYKLWEAHMSVAPDLSRDLLREVQNSIYQNVIELVRDITKNNNKKDLWELFFDLTEFKINFRGACINALKAEVRFEDSSEDLKESFIDRVLRDFKIHRMTVHSAESGLYNDNFRDEANTPALLIEDFRNYFLPDWIKAGNLAKATNFRGIGADNESGKVSLIDYSGPSYNYEFVERINFRRIIEDIMNATYNLYKGQKDPTFNSCRKTIIDTCKEISIERMIVDMNTERDTRRFVKINNDLYESTKLKFKDDNRTNNANTRYMTADNMVKRIIDLETINDGVMCELLAEFRAHVLSGLSNDLLILSKTHVDNYISKNFVEEIYKEVNVNRRGEVPYTTYGNSYDTTYNTDPRVREVHSFYFDKYVGSYFMTIYKGVMAVRELESQLSDWGIKIAEFPSSVEDLTEARKFNSLKNFLVYKNIRSFDLTKESEINVKEDKRVNKFTGELLSFDYCLGKYREFLGSGAGDIDITEEILTIDKVSPKNLLETFTGEETEALDKINKAYKNVSNSIVKVVNLKSYTKSLVEGSGYALMSKLYWFDRFFKSYECKTIIDMTEEENGISGKFVSYLDEYPSDVAYNMLMDKCNTGKFKEYYFRFVSDMLIKMRTESKEQRDAMSEEEITTRLFYKGLFESNDVSKIDSRPETREKDKTIRMIADDIVSWFNKGTYYRPESELVNWYCLSSTANLVSKFVTYFTDSIIKMNKERMIMYVSLSEDKSHRRLVAPTETIGLHSKKAFLKELYSLTEKMNDCFLKLKGLVTYNQASDTVVVKPNVNSSEIDNCLIHCEKVLYTFVKDFMPFKEKSEMDLTKIKKIRVLTLYNSLSVMNEFIKEISRGINEIVIQTATLDEILDEKYYCMKRFGKQVLRPMDKEIISSFLRDYVKTNPVLGIPIPSSLTKGLTIVDDLFYLHNNNWVYRSRVVRNKKGIIESVQYLILTVVGIIEYEYELGSLKISQPTFKAFADSDISWVLAVKGVV